LPRTVKMPPISLFVISRLDLSWKWTVEVELLFICNRDEGLGSNLG
jgi:hypothetical protein